MVGGVYSGVGVRNEEDEVNLGAFGGGEAFKERADCVGYILRRWAGDGRDTEAEGRGGWWWGGRGRRSLRVRVRGVDEGERLRFANCGVGFIVAMGAGEEEGRWVMRGERIVPGYCEEIESDEDDGDGKARM